MVLKFFLFLIYIMSHTRKLRTLILYVGGLFSRIDLVIDIFLFFYNIIMINNIIMLFIKNRYVNILFNE